MKILNIKNYCIPITASIMSLCPAKTAQSIHVPIDTFTKEISYNIANLTTDLKIEVVKNFKGGIITRFDSNSVQKLKKRILTPSEFVSYEFPLKDTANIYTEPFGAFFAKRPEGRKHLGLDIFTTKFATKPKKPVTIISPIDGYVISVKHARKEDNVIANSITILGIDGRRYAFDHLARETDYKTSIPMPEVGTHIKRGTPLGYMGRTGETVMWHLHFCVMTDEQLAKQLKDKNWLEMAAQSPYSSLRGQVNPRDKKTAGPIADILNKMLK